MHIFHHKAVDKTGSGIVQKASQLGALRKMHAGAAIVRIGYNPGPAARPAIRSAITDLPRQLLLVRNGGAGMRPKFLEI